MSFVPAYGGQQTTINPIADVLPMMIQLIMIVMIMKMMTKVTEEMS